MEIAIFKSDLWHNHVKKKKIKVAKKEDPQPGIRRKKITSNRGRIKKKCWKRYQEPALRRRVLIQTKKLQKKRQHIPRKKEDIKRRKSKPHPLGHRHRLTNMQEEVRKPQKAFPIERGLHCRNQWVWGYRSERSCRNSHEGEAITKFKPMERQILQKVE